MRLACHRTPGCNKSGIPATTIDGLCATTETAAVSTGCKEVAMERRHALMLAASTLLATVARSAEHDHSAHGAGASTTLMDAAQACVTAGQLCLAHCQRLLADGDKSMADCARSVSELIPVCQTLAALAAQGSAFVPRYAALAADVCSACETACHRHASEHEACRVCAEACATCGRACKAAAN